MGSFANTLFSVLLGWIQGTVSWLWNLIASADAGAWMGWVLDNWLVLVILLCLAGLAVDLVVYLLRWQPYRVWRSFLGRVTGRDEDEGDEADGEAAEPAANRRWAFATGEVANRRTARRSSLADDHLGAPIRPVKRVIPARQRRAERADGFDTGRREDAYNEPYYPPQWHTGEHGRAGGNGEADGKSDGGSKE